MEQMKVRYQEGCRDLNERGQKMREEHEKMVKTEEDKRIELADKFEDSIKEITVKIETEEKGNANQLFTENEE